MTTRPDPTEYDSYFGKYIGLVPEGDIVTILSSQVEKTLALLRTVPEEKAGHAYAPGKWSIKEVIGHVADTERIFAYRALRIGRNDKTPLAGFEQDDYVASTEFQCADTRQPDRGVRGSAASDCATLQALHRRRMAAARHGKREGNHRARGGVQHCRPRAPSRGCSQVTVSCSLKDRERASWITPR